MSERLFLDDAQYAMLRSLRDCRGPSGRTPKRRLLRHMRETYGVPAERAMRALSDLHRERLVRLDLAQRVFLAGGVVLHEAGSSGAPHSMRAEDGLVHLVLPPPTPAGT